jgi:DNA-binding PadR family transcriptional regulator
MKVGIKPSEQEILRHISQYGPKTGYELGKETEYSEKTSYQEAKNLVDKGLLTVSVVGKTRAGLDKKAYSLTVFGLVRALDITRLEEWQSIMKAWPDLIPLVTDKWDFFVSAGVGDLAMRRLKKAVRAMLFLIVIDEPVIPIDRICTDDIFSAYFYSSKTFTPVIDGYISKDELRWAKVCRDDPDIFKYFIMRMNGSIVMAASEIVAAEKMLDMLEDNKGKRKPILSEDFIMRRLPRPGTSAYRSMMNHRFHRIGHTPP